jgi:hypothetical protein
MQMCGTGKKCDEKVTTRVIRDTTYIAIHEVVKQYVPKVTKVTEPVYVVMHDSMVFFKDVDTAAILHDYFTTKYYEDSTKTQYGKVAVQDSVRENRIVSRSWVTDFKIPIVKETVPSKVKNQVYAGFSGLFSQQSIGAEINLTLKNKKDQQFEIGAGLFGTQPYGRIGTKFKLSFK